MRDEAGHQTDQESRSTTAADTPTVKRMDITIASSFLPTDEPEASLAFYRDADFAVRDPAGNSVRIQQA